MNHLIGNDIYPEGMYLNFLNQDINHLKYLKSEIYYWENRAARRLISDEVLMYEMLTLLLTDYKHEYTQRKERMKEYGDKTFYKLFPRLRGINEEEGREATASDKLFGETES